MRKRAVSLEVNGRGVRSEIAPRTHLADFLREELFLTGTRLGCEHGVCGACTVLIDDAPARSCIAFAIALDGARIRTIEGLDDDPIMEALREAFGAHHALQCGYCTPGMLITARDIVIRFPGANESRVREELGGNLCRCTGYLGIVEAILSVLADPPAFEPSAPRHLTGARSASLPRAARAAPPATSTYAAGMGDGKLGHRARVPIAVDALWAVLEDVPEVARCVPGLSIRGGIASEAIGYSMDVALGPMRMVFEGEFTVALQPEERRGRVRASGEEVRSRSTGEALLEFSAAPEGAGASMLEVSLDYALEGPLAQFGRAPVVSAVLEQMLERFARNVAALARGEEVREAPALGGIGLALRAAFRRLRAWALGLRVGRTRS